MVLSKGIWIHFSTRVSLIFIGGSRKRLSVAASSIIGQPRGRCTLPSTRSLTGENPLRVPTIVFLRPTDGTLERSVGQLCLSSGGWHRRNASCEFGTLSSC